MELHDSIMGRPLHKDLQSSMYNYALQIYYIKLHNYVFSYLTFSLVVWLNTTS